MNIRTILDDVIHQFSDPLAFFRELVQNSIDAGTGEISIELTHEVGAMGPTAQISVRDWGDGMNREIIETKLVRLFSSGKDDDLTKIGRFGIGFVSVFAIQPEAVVVDTGRDGEYWRVLFSADRTYELFALDEPIEGTHVQIFKTMDEEALVEMREKAKMTVVKWCKHASVPVYFGEEDVRQDFDLPSRFKLTHEEQGTRIVLGFAQQLPAFSGYYNRGLTLHETHQSPWPWASFKIDSRYLEHTLTRDQIIEDDHFDKASRILARLAGEELPERLMDAMERLAGAESLSQEYGHLCTCLGRYLEFGQEFHRRWRQRQIFKSVSGQQVSVNDARKAARRGRLFVTSAPGALSAGFESKNVVLLSGRHEGAAAALQSLLQVMFKNPVVVLEERYFLLDEVVTRGDQRTSALHEALISLLADAGMSVDEVAFANVDNLPLVLREGAGFIGRTTSEPIELNGRPAPPDLEHFRTGMTLLVNTTSQGMERLVGMANREPEWAALTAIKLLTVYGESRPQEEDRLLRAAVAQRSQRLEQAV